MQLKDFISQTITQLVQGVIEGHNNVFELGARVNPPISTTSARIQRDDYIPSIDSEKRTTTSFVEFDIAVLASEDTSSKGGLGIFVGGFGVGATEQSASASSQHNRIKFSLPIGLPTGWSKKHSQEVDTK